MSIETKIDELIAAIKANTAALTGKAGAASTETAGDGETKSTGRGRGRNSSTGDGDGETKSTGRGAKKKTREELTAIMTKVKEDISTAAAKAIIKEMGVEKLAEIDDADIQEAFKKCEEALAKADAAGNDDGGGDGL